MLIRTYVAFDVQQDAAHLEPVGPADYLRISALYTFLASHVEEKVKLTDEEFLHWEVHIRKGAGPDGLYAPAIIKVCKKRRFPKELTNVSGQWRLPDIWIPQPRGKNYSSCSLLYKGEEYESMSVSALAEKICNELKG